VDCAAALGRWLGAHGHALVWGGCNVGLMDVVGRAACDAGARTIAVIPEFLIERGLAFGSPSERVVTHDLASRKAEMRRRADAFVALPGGVGTWEEVLEVLALKKLGQLDRPILLANVAGCYDPLLELVRHSQADGTSSPELDRLYDVAPNAEALLERLGVAARLA
jgi:uncharacterized protein (TIGR00730 family)